MPDDRSDGASTIAIASPAEVQYLAVRRRKFALIVVGPVPSRAITPSSPANNTMTHGGALTGCSMKTAWVCGPRTGTCISSPEYAGIAVTTVHANAQAGTANLSNGFQSLLAKQVTGLVRVDFRSRILNEDRIIAPFTAYVSWIRDRRDRLD